MENKNVPSIRFKGFFDDWEQRKLNRLAKFSKGKGYTKGDLLEEGDPIILYGRLYTNYQTRIMDVDTYVNSQENSILSEGGEVIVPSSGETSEDIARASVVVNNGIILGGDLNIIKPSKIIEPSFLALTISNGESQKELMKKAQGNSVVHLYNSDLKKVKIFYPNFEEQIRIGNLFNQLDETITLQDRELELLKLTKKSFLQQLFPDSQQISPNIRFANYHEDWEQRKLGEVLRSHPLRTYLAEPIYGGEYEVIQQGDNPIIGTANGKPFAEYYSVILFGDHTVSLFKPQKPFFVATDGVKIISADNFDGNYLFTTLERYKPESQGYKRHFTILKNIDFCFTENKNEQIKIGTFFKQIEETISLQERKLKNLKIVKSAFLQKMFT